MDGKRYVNCVRKSIVCVLNLVISCREYNFQSVLTASSLVYGYAFLAPVAIWFIFKQYDATLKFVPVLCLYGYSLTIFLPAVVCYTLAWWFPLSGV